MKVIATTAGLAGPSRHAASSAAAFRILVVASDYGAQSAGTGKHTSELCEWLAARGHRVRVITAAQQRRAWFARERQRNLGIVRCPSWLSKPGAFALGSALAYSLFWRPHLVIAVAPPGAAVASLYARLTGAKAWLHVRTTDEFGAIEAPVARSLLHRFDVVSAKSEATLECLQRAGATWAQLRLLPDWSSCDAEMSEKESILLSFEGRLNALVNEHPSAELLSQAPRRPEQ